MKDEHLGPGGIAPQDTRELQDGGPALRISQPEHAAGPAFQAQMGWGTPQVEGLPDDEVPPRHVVHARARSARREFVYGGIGAAVLLLVAAVSFWTSGSSTGDATLQALAVAFVAIAASAVVLGAYLSRGD
jgi:hypothetical protein